MKCKCGKECGIRLMCKDCTEELNNTFKEIAKDLKKATKKFNEKWNEITGINISEQPHKQRHCPGLAEKKCFHCKDCAFITEESQNYFRNLLSKVDKVKTK